MSEIRTDTINNASGDNDSGIDLSTNDKVAIKTANTTAVTVDASQNVGIGTSSPTEDLDITKSTTVTLHLERSGATALDITASTAAVGAVYNSSYFHQFQTSGSERMRIQSNGRITTFGQSTTTGALNLLGEAGTSSKAIVFAHVGNGAEVGSISTGASSTSYNTSSDHRLKENVTADWDATTRLKQLNPVRFNFIADADTTVDGFLAHEVQSVVPEAITGTHNEVDDDGNPVYQGIDQSKLVPLLTGALKEAIAKIEALETRIEALENA